MNDETTFQRAVYVVLGVTVTIVGVLVAVIANLVKKDIDSKLPKEAFDQWKVETFTSWRAHVEKGLSAKLNMVPYYHMLTEQLKEIKENCKTCWVKTHIISEEGAKKQRGDDK